MLQIGTAVWHDLPAEEGAVLELTHNWNDPPELTEDEILTQTWVPGGNVHADVAVPPEVAALAQALKRVEAQG